MRTNACLLAALLVLLGALALGNPFLAAAPAPHEVPAVTLPPVALPVVVDALVAPELTPADASFQSDAAK